MQSVEIIHHHVDISLQYCPDQEIMLQFITRVCEKVRDSSGDPEKHSRKENSNYSGGCNAEEKQTTTFSTSFVYNE